MPNKFLLWVRAVDAAVATKASATTSTKAAECYYAHQPPMGLQRAAEARGVNMLMREPHVATRASELLDYAGWVHPLAAADVLAGETTEKRRCVTVSSLVPLVRQRLSNCSAMHGAICMTGLCIICDPLRMSVISKSSN